MSKTIKIPNIIILVALFFVGYYGVDVLKNNLPTIRQQVADINPTLENVVDARMYHNMVAKEYDETCSLYEPHYDSQKREEVQSDISKEAACAVLHHTRYLAAKRFDDVHDTFIRNLINQ